MAPWNTLELSEQCWHN